MAELVTMPKFGWTMKKGTIVKWLKREGDRVERGEPLLEVQTDKAVMEVESGWKGVLLKIVKEAGEVVEVTKPIGIIGEPGENIDSLLQSDVSRKETAGIRGEGIEGEGAGEREFRVLAYPAAKRLARTRGIDLRDLAGKYPGKVIARRDVLEYLAEAGESGRGEEMTAPGPGAAGEDEGSGAERGGHGALQPAVSKVIPLEGIRKVIAEKMAFSLHTAARVTITAEVDMANTAELRERISPKGVNYTDIILACTARALKDVPMVNSRLAGEEIHLLRDINIGLAVAVENGLLVPVLFHVDKKPLRQISAERRERAGKAREGKLGPEEMMGGTFTVTNLGSRGIDIFTPIINQPEAAILGVGQIRERVVVVEGQMVIRPTMWLSLVFDHRIIDGAPAADFLQRIRYYLENPWFLLAQAI